MTPKPNTSTMPLQLDMISGPCMCLCRPAQLRLTPVRQQRFMATPGGVRPADISAVVTTVLGVVRTALEAVPLGNALRADDALELLSKMHSGTYFEARQGVLGAGARPC